MKRLYNVDHSPAIVDINKPAIPPGHPHDFTDEQAKHLSGLWSPENPRAGLAQERAFQARRQAATDPAEPEKE